MTVIFTYKLVIANVFGYNTVVIINILIGNCNLLTYFVSITVTNHKYIYFVI